MVRYFCSVAACLLITGCVSPDKQVEATVGAPEGLIVDKRVDSVFFALVPPGMDRVETWRDYLSDVPCSVRSEIFNLDVVAPTNLHIPAANRPLSPMTITCTYEGTTRSFRVESEKVFLANPIHRATIMRIGSIRDEAVRNREIERVQENLNYWGYGNSIILNF